MKNTIVLLLTLVLCFAIAIGLRIRDPLPNQYLIRNIPFHRQLTEYSCGPAALQMVLEYWAPGVSIDQKSIMNVARTSPANGTLSYDILRTSQFSVMSAAATRLWPKEWAGQGFPNKPLGYAAYTYSDSVPWLDDMRNLLVADIPVIVLQNWSLNDTEGHYRIVVGYDLIADKMVMYDPWDRDGQPRVFVVSTSDFVTLWNKTETTDTNVSPSTTPFLGVAMMPWSVSATATRSVSGSAFQYFIKAEATYPCPIPFNCTQFASSNVVARLFGQTPVDGSMFIEPALQDVLGPLNPGQSLTYAWTVTCVSPSQAACDHAFNQAAYSVKFQGVIQGSVPATYCCAGNVNWPQYSYIDLIGGSASVTLA